MIWRNLIVGLILVGVVWIVAVGVEETKKETAAWREKAAQREKAIKRTAEHWQQRVATFRGQNNSLKKNVVLLGDSLTEGFDVAKYFPGKPVLNRGIVSDTIGMPNDPLGEGIRGVMNRLDVSVFDCCTTHVFLMIGVNDLGDGRTPEEMLVGYRHLLEAIKRRAPDVTIHVQSLIPTRGRFAHLNENIRKFNAMLRPLAEEMGCPYIDIYPLYADEKGELHEDVTRDGVHLKSEAYGPWKREIFRAMRWSDE